MQRLGDYLALALACRLVGTNCRSLSQVHMSFSWVAADVGNVLLAGGREPASAPFRESAVLNRRSRFWQTAAKLPFEASRHARDGSLCCAAGATPNKPAS
mmetsp:Transcript_7355/g.26856  ORF Transcript_7355/g.26856 Transcript_7355/m.26856 type:complete len:100 (-) Transcript_7355:2858-3157(-)